MKERPSSQSISNQGRESGDGLAGERENAVTSMGTYDSKEHL